MFTLIIAVISILLVAAIVAGTMFWGGDAFTNNSDKTEYAKAVNGASQIEAALNLHLADHGIYPPGTSVQMLETLVAGGYLKSLPDGNWTVGENILVRTIRDGDQCSNINRLAGMDTSSVTCPPCEDAAYNTWPACESSGG